MNTFNLFVSKSRNLIVLLTLLSLSIVTTSCGGGTGTDGRNIDIPGVDGPHVVLGNSEVLITMVFENVQLDGGLRYSIPKYPNSYVEISPDLQSSGTLMAFSIALDDIFDMNLNQLNPTTLPGGRPIPGVTSGRLPAVAFSLEQFHGVTVYLGPEVFGIFVPVNMGIQQAIVTARFYTDGARTGNISIVGSDTNGNNSGLLLMLDLGERTKKLLKRFAM